MLYIMRHGKTDWNALHKLQGRTDIPLNEEGRLMALKAHEEYKSWNIDVCYCSPLIQGSGDGADCAEKQGNSNYNR